MLRAYSLSERRQFDVLLGYPHLVQFLLILQNKLFYQGLSLWREFSFHDITRFDQERGIKILRVNIPFRGYRESGSMETVNPVLWKPSVRD